MLERKNQYDEAIKYYDKAISIDSDEIFLKNKAACIKNYLHDKIVHNNIEAHNLDLINEVLEMIPESFDKSEYLFTKAGVLELLGEPVKAKFIKLRLLEHFSEVKKAEKQLEKLKSSEIYINITAVHHYKHFEAFRREELLI